MHPKKDFQVLPGFITEEEAKVFDTAVRSCSSLFRGTSGTVNLGPRYEVIDGDQIRASMPDIISYEQTRIRPAVENFAGIPVQLLDSPRRSMRIQKYSSRNHGFRWHFDGHSYVAILTLKNGNLGETHLIQERLSSILRYFLYPLYPFDMIFSLAPYARILSEPGSLFLFRGQRLLHRGVTMKEGGERILVVYTYDESGKRKSRFRDFLARRLNY